MSESHVLPGEVRTALERMGLLMRGEPCHARALSGGVSSDIWLIETQTRKFCAKRALARLRVARVWNAPVTRNATEVAWFECAARIVPGSVPAVLGHDREAGVLAMEYLDHATHALWKELLRDGVAREADAAAVADTLVKIHAATADDEAVAREFATDAAFHALRLEPYLLATAENHPDRAPALRALVDACTANRRALVHGDVSPKNILIGPRGPVFLDAETAWYGDPAFDVAFCLNHLLLKCLWNPPARAALLASFAGFVRAYFSCVAWEDAAALERRTAALLPGLMLARVDGKSPVEYLDEAGKQRVRHVARELLAKPVATLAEIAARWQRELLEEHGCNE